MSSSQAGDTDSYRSLLGELADVIAAYLRSRFGDFEWTEDCVQESLLSIHRARHTYDPSRPFRPWLFTIVKHKAVDMLRRRSTRAQVEVTSEDAVARASHAPQSRQEQALDVERVLAWLRPDYREALILTKLEGRTIEEAAESAKITPSAMKSRVYRAIRLVQRRLERERA